MITALFTVAAFYLGFRFHAWYITSGSDYADFFGAVSRAAKQFRTSRAPELDDDEEAE